ncbi:MAG: TRAP transporter small permease subunit [Alphaproteobacteria bacterium]|nr:TRAP transporter small permease subunit [Alphaproteobacteria bacterium]
MQMTRLLAAVDRFTRFLAGVAMILFVVLISAMVFEVVARRVFNSPTIWAFDISYMTNGSVVFLGAAYTLLRNEHIRIDFLASRFPLRVQDMINAAFYIFAFLPALGVITWTALGEAWRTFITDELERVSTWAPVSWPFYTGIAIGLVGWWLQSIAATIRHVLAVAGRGPSPLRPGEAGSH